MNPLSHAAIFIDFENVYYFLKERVSEPADPVEVSIATVRRLRALLLEEQNTECIVQHAYADFERIGGSPQGAFYLIGIDTHDVLSTDHKNAADMRLCIDAMETLYTRKEITTFVFLAGDRDYIPVVQHLRKHAKHVLVVSFKGSMSGDLLQVVEDRNFIDAALCLPPDVTLVQPRTRPTAPMATKPLAPIISEAAAPPPPAPIDFGKPRPLESEDELEALGIMLEHFASKPEIWMTPYLHRQRQRMSHLAEYERRAVITELSEKGAIAVRKRPGDQGEYSVILLNWNHPNVQKLTP